MKLTQAGFSLFEALLGIAITVGAIFVTSQLQVNITRNQQELVKKLENAVDTSLAEKMIFSDLKMMNLSYNNVRTLDDAGLPFFDYFSDIPETSLGGKNTRTLTLTEKNEVIFIVQDSWDGPILVYDPIAAYNLGSTPKDFNTAASLDFVSLNNKNWLANQRKEYWINDKILLLDTSAKIRPPLNANGDVDMTVPPRSPLYLGKVKDQSFLDLGNIRTKINLNHPLDGSDITSADQFLRTVPSSGGGIPLVRVTSVHILRYYLESQNDKARPNARKLVKTSYDGAQFSNPVVIADNLESIVFKRDSVTEKVTYFILNKIK